MQERYVRIPVLHSALVAAAIAVALTGTARAELLFSDTFVYNNGEAVTAQADWVGDAAAGTVFVESGDGGGDGGSDSLTYAGLENLTQGGRVQVNNAPLASGSNDTFGADFSPDVTGEDNSLYISFLYKPVGANGTGNYMFYFTAVESGAGGTNQLGRITPTATNAPNHTLGARLRNSSSLVEIPPPGLPMNTTAFVVGKYTMVPGADNDTFALFINPTAGATEPATPDAVATETGQDAVAATGFDGFRFRVNSSASIYELDGLRVGTTWADVTENPTLDTTPPTIVGVQPADGAVVIGPMSHVAVEFDETVVNAAPSDVAVNGVLATAISWDGLVVMYSGFTPVAAGTANVVLSPGSITDLAGNPLAAGVSWSVEVASTVPLLLEHFEYAPGSTLANQGGWENVDNNTTEHLVLNMDGLGDGGTDSLQFAGLENLSAGGRLLLKLGSDDMDNRSFPAPVVGEGNAVYASFLFKPTVVGTGDTYFFHFDTVGSVQDQLGRLDTIDDLIGSNQEALAVRIRNSSSRVRLPSQPLTLGTTYFLVVKYAMVPGADNDTMEVWVNPTPGVPEPPAMATSLPDPGNDVNPVTGITGVSYRIGGSAGIHEVDELRAGTTWASVTDNPPADTAAPNVLAVFPVQDGTVYGSVTHVEVVFDEGVRGVTAGALTVGGAVATQITGFGAGPYAFSGFTPVGAGLANVSLAQGGVADLFGNALGAVPGWTVTVDRPTSDLIYHEVFDYPDQSALLANSPWYEIEDPATAAENLVVNPAGGASINYNDLPGIAGGRLQVMQRTAGSSVFARLPFGLPVVGESAAVYASFLYVPTGVPGDGYFAFFNAPEGGNGQLGRIVGTLTNDPSHTFAARWRFSGTTVEEAGAGHATGTPVLVVAKALMVSGAENDTLTVWIDPPLGLPNEGLASAVSPPITAQSTVGSNNDARPARGFDEFVIRTTTVTGDYDLDEIRLGTTWAAVTPSLTPSSLAVPRGKWMLYE